MTETGAPKFRERADHFRFLSGDGGDGYLRLALLEIAKEFDRAAAEIEGQDGCNDPLKVQDC
jgi:hypothetical protein